MRRKTWIGIVSCVLSLGAVVVANAEDASQSQQPIPLLAPGQGASSGQPQAATPPFGSSSGQPQAGADFFKALMEAQQQHAEKGDDGSEQDPQEGQDALIKLFDQLRQQQPAQPAEPQAPLEPPPQKDEATRIQEVRTRLPALRFGPDATVEERQQADEAFEAILGIQDLAVQDELVKLFREKEQAAYEPGAVLPPRPSMERTLELPNAAWEDEIERERPWEDPQREPPPEPQ